MVKPMPIVPGPLLPASVWPGEIDRLRNDKENVTNKVTSISSSSTNVQYPSAKCVYDELAGKLSSPASEGTNGQVLTTNGSGGHSWTSVQSPIPNYLTGASVSGGTLTITDNSGGTPVTFTGGSGTVQTVSVNGGTAISPTNGNIALTGIALSANVLAAPTGGTAGQFLKKTNSGTEWATVNVSPSSTLNSNSTIEIPSSKAVADWVNAETAVPGLPLSAWTTTGLSDGETIEEGPSREGRVWFLTTSVGIYICNASSSANTLDWDPYDDATEAAGATPVSAREVFRSTRGFEKYSNKVTSLNSSSSDEQYPSAKCVYDKLALKLESSDIANRQLTSSRVTSLSSDSADHQYPSAKCVYDALALKEDTANKATGISSSSTDTQYPSAKCVYDSINSAKPYAVNTLASGSAGSSNTLQLVAGAVNVLTMSQAADYTLILPQVASGTQEDLLLEITIVMGLGSMGSLSVVTPPGVTMSRFKLTSDVQLAIPPSGVLYNVYLMSYIIRAESSTSYRVFTSHRKAVSA